MKHDKEVEDLLYKQTIEPHKPTIDDLIYKYVNEINGITSTSIVVVDAKTNVPTLNINSHMSHIRILSSVVLDLLKIKK